MRDAALAAKNGVYVFVFVYVCMCVCLWRIAKDGRKLLTNRRLFENRRVKRNGTAKMESRLVEERIFSVREH